MKLKLFATLGVATVLMTACVLEGVTAGAVLGFIATNASRAGETVVVLKSALEKYKESETRLDKIKVLAEVSCHFRNKHPKEMDYLRTKLKEAGVSDQIVDAARRLADKKCPDSQNSSEKSE
ncbi:MAG: hypothetical protein HWE30_11670 [Methylocystaceae bacterium]|nr:hypothetical protein [Methylocystaceae bacterium]